MAIARIRKNDTVIVISGVDAGKTGTVTKVDPVKGTAVVAGVNVHKKAVRRTEKTPGGIIDKEAAIPACKVMLVCPSCKKATRIAHKFIEREGKKPEKVRVCKKCGATFEN